MSVSVFLTPKIVVSRVGVDTKEVFLRFERKDANKVGHVKRSVSVSDFPTPKIVVSRVGVGCRIRH